MIINYGNLLRENPMVYPWEYVKLISPNEDDDVNLYFRNVILEKQGENVGRTR